MPRKKISTNLSFEQALEELETMVESMESGQLPLEQLITDYERGASLISHCESVLDSAKKRLELITLKPKNSTESSPEKSNPSDTSSIEPDHNDDEIRLF